MVDAYGAPPHSDPRRASRDSTWESEPGPAQMRELQEIAEKEKTGTMLQDTRQRQDGARSLTEQVGLSPPCRGAGGHHDQHCRHGAAHADVSRQCRARGGARRASAESAAPAAWERCFSFLGRVLSRAEMVSDATNTTTASGHRCQESAHLFPALAPCSDKSRVCSSACRFSTKSVRRMFAQGTSSPSYPVGYIGTPLDRKSPVQ